MGLNKLEELLERKNQRFICIPAGAQSGEHTTFTAYITHEVSPPLASKQLKELEEKIGYHDQLFKLLSMYGSVRLFCDSLSDNSAYYLAHPDEWSDLYQNFNMWLENLDENERKDFLPGWIENALVIGEIPSSGNYYLFPLSGDERGKVFEFEHDGFEFIEEGKDLYRFIDKISTVNESLINNILSHTRYSDGKTDTQWLAQRYECDRS